MLQPYGFSPIDRALLCMGFLVASLITFAVSYYGLPQLLPQWFKEGQWSVLRAYVFMLYNFLIIGFWVHILNAIWLKNDPAALGSSVELVESVLKTLFIGAMASALWILVRFNVLSRKHLHASQEVNIYLREELEALKPVDSEEHLQLSLEGRNISVKRNELVYISSEGNYVAFHQLRDGKITKTLYRERMKDIEEMLSDSSEFFRCHRSFLVNLSVVKATHGNSQGLFIELHETAFRIPVARPKIGQLRKKIMQRSGSPMPFKTK